MYIVKLPNAAAHKITVTATATTLLSLIDTAAGSAADLKGDLNAVLMSVEDGDIRVTFDGSTPTAANGLLISSGARTYFANVPLSKMKLIRVTADVAVSIEVGYSHDGETSVMSGSGGGASSSAGDVAHDAVDSGNPVKIGFYAVDPASMPADVAAGDRVNGVADLKGRQIIYEGTLGYGEDSGNGVQAIAEKPLAVSTYTPDLDSSAAAEASSVTKASAGVLYAATAVNSSASSRYLQFFNSASVPANGTVPVLCYFLAAGASIDITFDRGRYFDTGISWCWSSTAATKTIGSTDGLVDARYK